MREGGKMKNEKMKMNDEQFLEQYLAGKAPLHADRLSLPSKEELDAAEAEFDKMITAHKRPAHLLPLWPWVGAAVAAMLVVAFLLWPEKPMPVTEEVEAIPAPTANQVVAYETLKPKESPEPHNSQNSHNSSEPHNPPSSHNPHRPNIPQQPAAPCEAPPAEPQKPILAQAEPMPQPEKEEEAPVIPPDKQALADIFLAEEALQVAYKIRAQQEAIRAYAASLTGEEPPKPIIAF